MTHVSLGSECTIGKGTVGPLNPPRGCLDSQSLFLSVALEWGETGLIRALGC